MDLSRRGFIKLSAGAAAAGGALAGAAGDAPAAARAGAPVMLAQAGRPGPLGFDPADPALKYELVVANGDVLDPVQRTRGKRDIGIRFGQIAAPLGQVVAGLEFERARRIRVRVDDPREGSLHERGGGRSEMEHHFGIVRMLGIRGQQFVYGFR